MQDLNLKALGQGEDFLSLSPNPANSWTFSDQIT